MIKLLFSRQGAYFGFTIHHKVIKGIMGKYILPYQPSDLKEVEKQVKMSRNKIPKWFVALFKVTDGEQKQYENAKDDDALCKIIINDAERENAKLISKIVSKEKEKTNGKNKNNKKV